MAIESIRMRQTRDDDEYDRLEEYERLVDLFDEEADEEEASDEEGLPEDRLADDEEE